MTLHKLCAGLTTAVILSSSALAQPADGACQTCDAVGTLPGPGVLSLVVLGIAAAIGLARRYS